MKVCLACPSLLLLIRLQIIVTNFSSILHNFYASLQSIPPVTRMAMGRGTWVTVLCKKLRTGGIGYMMFLSKINFTWRMKLHLVDELIMVRTAGCRRRSSDCCLTWVSSYPSSPLTEYLVVISYLITSAQLFCFVQSGNWTVQDTWSSNSIIDPESYMWYTLWGVCPYYSVRCLKNTIEPMSSAFWNYTNCTLVDRSL